MKKVKFGKVKYKLKMRNGYVMMKKVKCGNMEFVLNENEKFPYLKKIQKFGNMEF